MTEHKDPVLAWGEHGTVYRDGTFRDYLGDVFSRAEMNAIKKQYQGCNRIHKPYYLLFYTDIMNGKRSEWLRETADSAKGESK